MVDTPTFLHPRFVRRCFPMKTLGLITLVSVLAIGCASGNDPGESGTEIGSGGTEGDTTAMTTEPGPTTTTSTTTPDPTTDDDSTTTDAAESSSSTGGGSTSTGSESSTGDCPAGTEGCPCDPAADPTCGKGLSCNADDVCEVALCDAKDDEINDDPNEPTVLMDVANEDELLMSSSQLSGDTDVDWFRHHCQEPFFGLTSPSLEVTVPEGVRACVFLDCDQGGNPEFTCPEETTPDNAPLDNMPGCCVTGSGSFEIIDPNCPDGSNDDVDAYLRFDQGVADSCSAYEFTYGC